MVGTWLTRLARRSISKGVARERARITMTLDDVERPRRDRRGPAETLILHANLITSNSY
jgi:hypothetical protein